MAAKIDLPVRYSLTPAYVLSMVIALFMTAASAAGILFRATVYPTEELLQSFFPNDIVNLVIGVPILVVSMWLARRGKLIGLLFQAAMLFFGVIVFLALQWVLTAAPIDAVAIVMMLLLGLTCFIPFLLFARRLK